MSMVADVSKRSIDVNFIGDEAEVKVWAPLAESVEVVLPKKGIALSLDKIQLGYWCITTDKIKDGDFRLSNDKELPDPASISQPNGVHEASQALEITNFSWSDSYWNNIPPEDYIFYELHTGTFISEGTFAALEEKLDHLKELGITAIEIMPVAQFPGNRNWGYGVYPFCVHSSYGGVKSLKHLGENCHSHGLAVVLDVVYNRMGPEGNYLGEYTTFAGSAILLPPESILIYASA